MFCVLLFIGTDALNNYRSFGLRSLGLTVCISVELLVILNGLCSVLNCDSGKKFCLLRVDFSLPG